MRLDELEIDLDAIENGAWRDAIGLPGVQFKLRGAGNMDWRRLHSKLVAELPRERRLAGNIDPADIDRIESTLLVETCLLDWKGFQKNDGTELPFDKKELPPDLRRVPRFKQSLLLTAEALASETIAEREEAAKN